VVGGRRSGEMSPVVGGALITRKRRGRGECRWKAISSVCWKKERERERDRDREREIDR
jgi:hypothetical protein